jgi:DNA-binding LacI/PurR family transcriptional regulator
MDSVFEQARPITQATLAKKLGVFLGRGPSGALGQARRQRNAAAACGSRRSRGGLSPARGGAGQCAAGGFNTITVLLSAFHAYQSSLSQPLLRGMAEALDQRRLHLSISMVQDDRLDDPGYAPQLMREWCSDGVLVNYNVGTPEHLVDLLADVGLPAVYVNCKRPTDAVYPDDYNAGRRAAELLLLAGHRRIAYHDHIHNADDQVLHYSRLDRREGFIATLIDAGVRPVDLPDVLPGATFEAKLAMWHAVMSRPDRPTAVCSYALDKLHPMFFALDRLELKMPEDISLVVFGDETAYLRQSYTTLLVPIAEVGRRAVLMLDDRIDSGDPELPSRAVPFGVTENFSIHHV